jgi:TonB-dependent receptor
VSTKLFLTENASKIKNLSRNNKENKMAIGAIRFRASLVCAIVVSFSITFQSLYAAGSGSIKGHIFDKVTSDPLIGANVVVLNTSLGASSNVDGVITIFGAPAGQQTLKISYIGYQTITVQVTVPENGVLEQEFRLSPQTIEGQEVVVTAQASGQNAAINQQLTSSNITNVVSSARIQALPDANAAESIGRLPGISLVRNGGEATQVVIRGLQPKYNSITIDGVPIPANDAGSFSATNGDYAKRTDNPGGRSVDMSMISSSSLEGIEVFKTVTPDMDAAAIGGTVNFDIRRAKSNPDGAPSISLLAQDGYNDLMSSSKDYKFVASIEKRFFDDKFGVFVQGIAQRQNLTSDQLGAFYYNSSLNVNKNPDTLEMGYTTLTFIPSIQKRYDGTITFDYKIPNGELALFNIVSHGTTTSEQHSDQYTVQNYTPLSDRIIFGTSLQENDLNVVSNILSYKQEFGSFKVEAKLSNAYSDNSTPYDWYMDFIQQGSGAKNISANLTPADVVRQEQNLINLNQMSWTNNTAWSSFNKQDDKQALLDVKYDFNLSDLISLSVKGGGAYKYTTRYNDYDYWYGHINDGSASVGFRSSMVQALPWLAQAPYNLDPTGQSPFPISGFYNKNMDFGKFLKGEYSMYSAANADVIDQLISRMKSVGAQRTAVADQPDFLYDMVQSTANDYSGNEIRSAVYLMATLNIGPWISVIPGARYQALRTSYTAAHFMKYDDTKIIYPNSYPYTMVTDEEYHGYWLPDLIIKYNPSDVIGFRASFTNTIAYPDFNTFVPKEDIGTTTKFITWNNTSLKPERAYNYDFQISIHDNTIGLFAVSPFLKTIDNQIFNPQNIHLDSNQVKAFGFPSYTNLYTLNTYINNPFRINEWGIETEWQTHFWYLPGPLSGLVMNINYTHIFSQGKFPYTNTVVVFGHPVQYVDTSFIDRLIQQPNDVVNLSLGYDYRKFSILASMIYQSDVFNESDFYWTLRSDKTKYLRWDLAVKQGLPWNDLELYLDINDVNSEADIYTIRKNGFPTAEYNYGLTADLGIRWRFN